MKHLDLKARFHNFEDWLEQWPSPVLTILLIALAIIVVVVALFGNAMTKAIVAAWILFP